MICMQIATGPHVRTYTRYDTYIYISIYIYIPLFGWAPSPTRMSRYLRPEGVSTKSWSSAAAPASCQEIDRERETHTHRDRETERQIDSVREVNAPDKKHHQYLTYWHYIVSYLISSLSPTVHKEDVATKMPPTRKNPLLFPVD
jgi:hypothetical protein